MKAIEALRYGAPDFLQLKEVDKPIPKSRDVLIRVYAASVTRGDVFLQNLPFIAWLPLRIIFGLKRKSIPGHEFAGTIAAVGSAVTSFKKGDRVFGTTTGLPVGSCAEYLCLSQEGTLAEKPGNMTYEEAAAVPVGGLTALYFLRKGKIRDREKVLIFGASGSVGTFAVQIAKYYGAEVTGVSSTVNTELVRSLGADKVVDYTKEDFADRGERYDIIFDAVGKIPGSKIKEALATNGRYVTVRKGIAIERSQDLIFLKGLIEAGKIRTVIDRRYSLEQTAQAYRYVGENHKKGNVVITIDQNLSEKEEL
ncbi:NAD(P)-dependent alcohol dehydrogenase [Sediminispirochaeta smaragdinae]|uniref:Alcohol dehydrogenase zinc-binding domain protein n=1 Tax=Sediminispirochaeta smaragdinae (strain DSM 11293 / JCM 15392 / SEBR 4228) TaxID=573413 RepID=E1R868_SEDSS|nr:NAD(P)-dependent alcohol dehydrogenase [Sediminispirochaeta smaragdinae]ADK82923.1 Alcohol dehydrogenase zinc-binding domain protein [Sediminispirochaeta smaragdinae DSM 11293]